MSDAHLLPSDDQCEEELKQALTAAFGEDAMSLMEEPEEEIPAEILDAFGAEISTASSESSESAALEVESDQTHAENDIGSLIDIFSSDNDSPRTRWMKNLSAAIYSGHLKTDQQSNEPAPRMVVFAISDLHFGLPLADVREIARYPKVTALPCTPSWLRGVANFRGQILSVTDFRNLIRDSSQRPTVGEKVIVVQSQESGTSTALVVDRVIGIRSFGGEVGDLSSVNQEIAVIASGTVMLDHVSIVSIDPDQLLKHAEPNAVSHQLS
jgi:chemotaxis signal transduction protein